MVEDEGGDSGDDELARLKTGESEVDYESQRAVEMIQEVDVTDMYTIDVDGCIVALGSASLVTCSH